MHDSMGDVIRAWREYRGLKPAQLAEAAGLSRAYLSQLEHNKIARPSDQQLSKLAQALAIPFTTVVRRHLPDETEASSHLRKKTIPQVSHTFSNRPEPESLGSHIEKMIADAQIPEQEKQIVAERLVRVTHEMVDLVETTHKLKSRGVYQQAEELLTIDA